MVKGKEIANIYNLYFVSCYQLLNTLKQITKIKTSFLKKSWTIIFSTPIKAAKSQFRTSE